MHAYLGVKWNIVFFSEHKIGQSVAWMGAFWASVVASIASFYQVNTHAGYLMAPTLGWVSVAAYLNWTIAQINPKWGVREPTPAERKKYEDDVRAEKLRSVRPNPNRYAIPRDF